MRPRRFLAPLTLSLALGCSDPSAMGEASSLILFSDDALFREVEDATYEALEPTIFTVRDEKQYEVTSVEDDDPAIPTLRQFVNVLVFGTGSDPMLQEVAEAGGVQLSDMMAPRVFQATDVWARGQTVTGVLLREGREVESWLESLPSVLAAVDQRYRAWVRRRMFVTTPDTALAADLARRFGFRIIVPRLYDRVARGLDGGDSLVILRNDNPDPSQLIRSILVHPRAKPDSLTSADAIAWREGIDGVQYNVAQGIRLDNSSVTSFSVGGAPALEVTGAWFDEVGNFPAGGPFMIWVVDCPSRAYYIDAWLYAPNAPKYEYMLQLQEILGSFECS